MILFKPTPEGKAAAIRKAEFAEKEWCHRAEVIFERGLSGPEFDGYAVRMYCTGELGEYFAGYV